MVSKNPKKIEAVELYQMPKEIDGKVYKYYFKGNLNGQAVVGYLRDFYPVGWKVRRP